ncbi:hypothetical protein VTH06DRAFT_4914 [Thermothelomyces fergusii]
MKDQQVHVANGSDEDIYVLVSPTPDWEIVDLALDVALSSVAIGKLGIALQGIAAGGELKTISQLASFVKELGAVASAAGIVESRNATSLADVLRAARGANEQINRTFTRIPRGEFGRVYKKGFGSIYMRPSGYAGLAGVRTLQVLIKNEDGSRSALFSTHPDHSWIATDHGSIVRAKYGRIWVQQPGGRSIDWPKEPAKEILMDDKERDHGVMNMSVSTITK